MGAGFGFCDCWNCHKKFQFDIRGLNAFPDVKNNRKVLKCPNCAAVATQVQHAGKLPSALDQRDEWLSQTKDPLKRKIIREMYTRQYGLTK